MKRRELLLAVGAGATAGVAGCSTPESEPSPTPTPGPSELRLSVENSADEPRSATFTLTVTSGNFQSVQLFELTGIRPGETRTRDPQDLDAGEYELEVEIPPDLNSTIEWAGNDCPRKEVTVEIRPNGFRIRDSCPDS